MGTHQKLSSVQSFTVSVNDKDLERVYKFKYLGVILDPCLTWNENIEHIGNKILSRLGMLCRARKVIPKEACITLFNAMVLPLFDCCCVVWDGCGQGNKNYLDRLLKRAAGIIAGRKATDTDIQQTLKWPSLQCRSQHQKCIQVCKCINGLAPAYLLDDFHSSEQIHITTLGTKTSSACLLPRLLNFKHLLSTMPPNPGTLFLVSYAMISLSLVLNRESRNI